ncbi:nucleotidyltransferase domain-containing protein [Paenibacillus sp. S150]|nr:nucleotidyltransferase domain-containing protein [Paenibacillus sp. S150]MBW4084381.1 nucleotidyltransferase domain-containing protein [Paenibacillus sp. S150]
MSEIHESVTRQLRAIESEENVRILYACESGSRAWGFPSKDRVNRLLVRKMSGDELNLEPRLEVINKYLESQISHYEEIAVQFGHGNGVADTVLDELFRSALPEVWGGKSRWAP